MNRLRPNGRGLALRLAIFAGVLCAQSAGSAQVENTYTIGHQLWMGYVVIPANTTFEFRTDYNMGGQFADTVLTLYDWANQDTLEGADGCVMPNGQFEWGPSCFQWTNNSNSPKGAFLIARAWRTQTPADTQIHAYDPILATSGPVPGFFGSTGIVTVGGAHVERTIATGRQHWSTAHMPGNSARHMLMVADHHDILFLSTTSDIATGLAEADTGDQPISLGNREFIYGGWGASNVGAVRLLKNDWFNNDADRDGLGTALEASLGTCDGVNDVLATGQTCDGRFAECQINGGSCSQCDSTEECIAGVCRTQSCAARLRDTDHDGLRDDVEVYGYGGLTTQMARFGADPLHKDVFIEMHTTDRVAAGGCEGFALGNGDPRDPRLLGNTDPNSTEDFFVRAQEIFDNVALPGSLNPDGSDGITLHFDVGVANPNATDVSWGDWGGGNTCYLTNNYRADCASDLSPARAWLFRWGLDTLGAKAGGNCYYARNTTSHVHEIGHMLGLAHGGPYGTSAEEDNGANNRPSYPSRINYRFQGVVSNDLAFSSASIEGAVSSRSADETDPFGETHPDTVAALRQGSPTVDVWPVVPAGAPAPQVNVPGGEFNQDVDWNGINGIDLDPTIWGRYRNLENGRNARESAGKSHNDADLNTSIYGTHMDAAIIDDLLVFAYVDYDHEEGLPGTVFLKWNRDGVCDTVPTQSGSSWSYGPCIALDDADAMHVTADAVSVASTRVPAMPGTGTQPGIVLVYRVGTQLRWQSYYTVASGGNVITWPRADGVFPGYTTNNTQVDATLVEVPQSASNPHGGVLMIYQDSNSVLRQRFLPSGSNTWTGSAQVQTSLSSGTHYSYGDVGAVAYGDKVYLAARHSSVTGIRIYSVPAGAGVNTTWTFETTVPSTQGVGTDIELAVAPAPPGTTAPEFFVMYRDNDNVLLETRAELPNFTNWTNPDDFALETGERSESGVALVYDDRSAGRAGLRAYRNLHRRCDGPPGDGVGTACDTLGYAPGRPTDLTCIGGTFCYSASLDFAGAARPSHITQSPFAEGHNPTLYCDYNDNAQMAWAMCQYLLRRDAPTGTSDFVVTPYDSSVRCAMPPRHPEPQTNGTCGPLASTSVDESDRTNNPGAYIPPDEEVICTE